MTIRQKLALPSWIWTAGIAVVGAVVSVYVTTSVQIGQLQTEVQNIKDKQQRHDDVHGKLWERFAQMRNGQ